MKALANSKVALGRTSLLDVATAGKTLLGKPKIAPKSALVLAALRSLTLAWTGHPDAERVFESARRSKDPEIRAAVQPAEEPGV